MGEIHFDVPDDRRVSFHYYQNIIEYFTLRTISLPEDRLNAYEGLLSQYRKFSKTDDSRFSFGLPLANFTYALCWISPFHAPESRRIEFPSWSWAGWNKHAAYHKKNHSVDIRSNMIHPAIADESVDGRVARYICPPVAPRL